MLIITLFIENLNISILLHPEITVCGVSVVPGEFSLNHSNTMCLTTKLLKLHLGAISTVVIVFLDMIRKRELYKGSGSRVRLLKLERFIHCSKWWYWCLKPAEGQSEGEKPLVKSQPLRDLVKSCKKVYVPYLSRLELSQGDRNSSP